MSTFVGAVTDSIESVGKNKLYGYRFSPTVQEVLHTIELTKAPITLEDISWDDEARRAEILPKAPTQTLPLLETDKGLLSQSKAIELYLVETYKPDMYGTTPIEKALINQWIDFATQEIYTSSRPLVYPIFGWMEHDKDLVNESGKELLNNLKIVDKHLEGKKYLVGDKMTLADVVLVNKIRLLFMMIYTDGLRTHQLKNLNDYFISIMETPEAKKAYGRTLLCKQPVRAYIKPKEDKKKEEKKKEEKKKEEKKEKKEKEEDEEEKPKKKPKNPLDELPPSKLELETFKRAFLNNKDKEDAMNKFWEVYDPDGYSLWWMEYQNLPEEGKILFRTSNAKGMFLQKLDNFRKYAFGVHGVYGSEGDYKIRGVWMWRGTDIPNEMKEHDNFPYMTIKKLDINKPEDKQMVNDYWTKVNETDQVDGRFAADVEYFN